jgi:ketosteroid isomerase-like protein
MSIAHETAIDLTRHFIEALNARDLDDLTALTADDAEFRTPQGQVLVGTQGVENVMRAAADARILLVRDGLEQVEETGASTLVTVPVKEIVGKSEVTGTAHFEIRDGKIAGFEVLTEMTER